jgi:hypothetical protein
VTPEGRVKKMVNKALSMLGADCWRFMPVQTGYGIPALDYLLSVRGRFVAIETKAPGKKLTPLQESTKAAIEAAGGIVLVVWDEGSLAIAMKIILALEFAPDGRLNQTLANWGNSASSAETQRYFQQHVRKIFAPEETDPPAGGDHGAPAEAPDGRAQPRTRRKNQSVTAAVTAGETAGGTGDDCSTGNSGAWPPQGAVRVADCVDAGLKEALPNSRDLYGDGHGFRNTWRK